MFIEGAIPSSFIGEAIQKHQSKLGIGAHNIFLGQVRADQLENGKVNAIEYTTYEEMATKQFKEIKEQMIVKYDLKCMHIYHSLGKVEIGEICFFVFVSAVHRKQVYQATEEIVNLVKDQCPIFGKELLEEGEHVWKKNS